MKIGGLFGKMKIWILAAKNKMKTRMSAAKKIVSTNIVAVILFFIAIVNTILDLVDYFGKISMSAAKKIVSNNIPAVILFFISIAGIILDLVNRFGENNLILSYFPKWLVSLAGNLSYSVLVGVIIWFIFTYYYERKQVKIIKNRLSFAYSSFKRDVIKISLAACEKEYDSRFIKYLSYGRNFLNYLWKNDNRIGYLLANQLDDPDNTFRDDLLNELRSFQEEISNMLNANVLSDETTYNYFNNVSKSLTNSIRKYDYILSKDGDFYNFDKILIQHIEYFVGRHSVATGYVEEHIEEMIQKI